MKKILLTLLSAAALLVCACDKYDDTPLRNELSSLEQRVKNLEDLCSKLNTNIASIQTLLTNIDSKIAIERVVTLDNNEGYLITFSDGASIKVYNGLDGSAGPKGDKGEKGEQGEQGDPGDAPVIGVKTDGGVIYWTLNGEWLLDDEGNKIPVVGQKGDKGDQGDPGNAGNDGYDGDDGVTPQLKIENGKWMVSYDDGSSWNEVPSSSDDPSNTNALTIEETEDAYIFTVNGESYTISKAASAVSFQIKVENDDITLSGETSVTLKYTLTGGDETTHVVAEGSLNGEVDDSACTVTISSKDGTPITEGYVILRAVRNSDGASSAQYIGVAASTFTIITAKEVSVDGNGGTFEVKVKTNLEYDITQSDWITQEPDTKAVHTDTKNFSAKANRSGAERTGTITFKTKDGAFEEVVVVTQPVATSGDGSLASPFSPAEAVDAVKDLTWTSNSDYEKVGPYYIKGKISRIPSGGTYTEGGTYGNATFYISEDGTENDEFYCFRILYLDNKKFTEGQTDIKVGDEVVIYGEIMNYRGNTPETVSGKAYLYSLNGSGGAGGDDTEVKAVTVAEFNAAAESDSQVYELVGTIGGIINTTYGNFDLTDETGSVYVYGLTATELGYGTKNDKSFSSLNLDTGDKIKIRGYRGAFEDKIEVLYAWFIEKVSGGGDTPAAGTADNPYTVAQALDAIKDLTWTSNTDYETTDEVYMKGKITRIASGGTFTEGGTYGNASFYISDDGTETNEFYCFRILYLGNQKFEEGQTDIKVGDDVVVCGQLMNYRGNTPETVSGKAYLYSLNASGGGGDTPGGGSVSFATNSEAQTWAAATDGTYGSGYGTTTQGVSVAYYKHTASNAPVAPNANHIRVYKNSVLIITAPSGKTMKSIVITAEPNSGTTSYCWDMTGLEGGANAVADKSALTVSWSGSASKVVLHANNGQVRVNNIAIEFE